MRNAPQPPSAQDLAASNATSSAFLGGRQKPWMTGSNQASVLLPSRQQGLMGIVPLAQPRFQHATPAGRPLVPPSPLQIPARRDSSHAAFKTSPLPRVAEDLATTSTSVSPNLPNSIHSPALGAAYNTPNAFPSPVPSEDLPFTATIRAMAPNTDKSTRIILSEDEFNKTLGKLQHGNKRHGVDDLHTGGKKQRAHIDQPTRVSRPPQVQHSISVSPPIASPIVGQSISAPRTFSALANGVPASAQHSGGQTTTSKSSRPPSRNDQVYQTCVQMLEQYIAQRANSNTPISYPEEHLLNRLRLSCEAKDYAYLFLVQMTSAWKHGYELPPTLASMQGLQVGMKLLWNILISDSVDGLAQSQFYPLYPQPWQNLHTGYLAGVVATVRDVIINFSYAWQPFCSSLISGTSMPSVHEIEKSFKISSTMLQKDIFAALLRFLRTPQGPCKPYDDLHNLFLQDQGNGLSNPQDSSLQGVQANVAARYRGLLQAYMQTPMQQQQQQQQQRFQQPLPYHGTSQAQPTLITRHPVNASQVAQIPHRQNQQFQQHHQQAHSIRPVSSHRGSHNQQAALGFQAIPSHQQYVQQVISQQSPHSLTYQAEAIHNRQQSIPSPQVVQRQQSGTIRPPDPPRQTALPNHREWRTLVPPEHFVPLPQRAQPDPNITALHELHLRSPAIVPDDTWPEKDPSIYCFVSGFAMSPIRTSNEQIQQWTFPVPEIFPIPSENANEKQDANLQKSRLVSPFSHCFRLRCIKNSVSGESKPLTESEWVVKDTNWIPDAFWEVNGVDQEPRKKRHNGKDLALDITDSLRKGEDNMIKLFVLGHANGSKPLHFTIAVEIVSFLSGADIRRTCMSALLSAEQVLASIQSNLVGNATDDEDLCIVDENVVIDLSDPWLGGQMWKVPIRGKACRHRNCFDLDTLLTTRKSRALQPLNSSYEAMNHGVDDWRCPICLGDVRPKSLVVDGFLMQVRDMLAEQDKLDTRTIVIEKDGTWKPKPSKGSVSSDKSEVAEDIQPRDTPQSEHAPNIPVARGPLIICLDDDDDEDE